MGVEVPTQLSFEKLKELRDKAVSQALNLGHLPGHAVSTHKDAWIDVVVTRVIKKREERQQSRRPAVSRWHTGYHKSEFCFYVYCKYCGEPIIVTMSGKILGYATKQSCKMQHRRIEDNLIPVA